MTFTKRDWLLGLGIIVLFFALRLPAVFTPYHQDEYKWPLYAEEVIFKPGSIPHPPLTEFIYRVIGKHIGLDNFRFIPLTFGFINLFLLFYLVRSVTDKKSAFWSIFIYSVSFYSILANLMVDVDGSVMPFFFLLLAIGYFKLKAQDFILTKNNLVWLLLLLAGLIGGFLIKVSFLLGVLAFGLDFLISKNVFNNPKNVVKYFGYGFLGILVLVGILFGARFLFPFFDLAKAFKYWEHFAVLANRGWLQTFIQFIKSVFYASPLLLAPIFLVNRDIWRKWRPMFLFIFIGTLFYLFAFDFSLGAIDRYFQFVVVPLTVIVGAVFGSDFQGKEKISKTDYSIVAGFGVIVFLSQFIYQGVPPLYPKTAWLGRILDLKWNFLFPFMGGSGPIPFYVSFLFIATTFLLVSVLVIFGFGNSDIKKRTLFAILVLGLMYNLAFTEEYLFGLVNGSSKKLVAESVEYINKNPEIKQVLVYNDTGGYNIRKTGKYFRRLYATPQFEDSYRDILSNFRGHVLMIDIPKISDDNLYTKYLQQCLVVLEKRDRQITVKIFDCRNQ